MPFLRSPLQTGKQKTDRQRERGRERERERERERGRERERERERESTSQVTLILGRSCGGANCVQPISTTKTHVMLPAMSP